MTDREKILNALREKPLKTFEIMKGVNIRNQEDCQSLLLKMRDEGMVKFDIHKGHWLAALDNRRAAQKAADRGTFCYRPFRKSRLRRMMPGGVPSNSLARNLQAAR